MAATAMVSQVPALGAMAITQDEADALGNAWATYIDSFPAKQKRAAMESMERIMPGLVAFGTTVIVFAPRVKTTQEVVKQKRVAVRPATEPPFPPPFDVNAQRFAQQRQAGRPVAPPPPSRQEEFDLDAPGAASGLTPQQRASIIHSNDDIGLV